ncbi:Hypothetical predicted protein [Olea europaea subsp. europaea]|uniref:Smr domain-containing protein n=1 Tax=Olea europaea subsp. europaea TaxID=158383 RepID=A0A8S0TVI8_OLEEU|nr:Hypothetical predicted protein [Olea europaea subsp. europaea]
MDTMTHTKEAYTFNVGFKYPYTPMGTMTNVYEEMKALGVKPNLALYNNLLDAMGRAKRAWQASEEYLQGDGHTDEAVEIFEDMKSSGTCMPDSWTFSSLITIHSWSGKVKQAEATVNEMVEAGIFNWLLELSVTPDERFCGCLLNVMTQAPKEELSKLMGCIERTNAKLGRVVKILTDEDNFEGEIFKKEAGELFECIVVFALEEPLSRAALTALHIWVNDLSKTFEDGEELPSLLGINTGHGKHKYSEKGLAGVFESHLKELNAPFHEAPD